MKTFTLTEVRKETWEYKYDIEAETAEEALRIWRETDYSDATGDYIDTTDSWVDHIEEIG